ncbi:flagellum site-determining protein YlxH [Ferrovum sp. JA12]|uniref:iron-sulfur cluster carrier protein ApbC n=1 Tax=Ferrovum sp. JA12 TaxID=1356299 RepID=UPI000715D59B|nr:iron-sulfur cluster carrier protein ApbC [Ferrovum sp. JA12]KRH78479.1 flagellum site-determining protein YlxH [Ferrovum sp. JA12]HQT81430.1 iron-sulfur cluster carrier protein ApbC [Ferrovaceae bacterium]
MDTQRIEALLNGLTDPFTLKTFGQEKALKSVNFGEGTLTVHLEVGYPAKHLSKELTQLVVGALRTLESLPTPAVTVTWKIATHTVQGALKPLEGIKNIIAIASGKGGVGKSTTAVNLALALQDEGAQVAILDADIYGPSQPTMLGIDDKPTTSEDGRRMRPLMNYGLQTMSVGYLIDPDQPMVWRGPMVTQALEQLIRDTAWNNVDYLIVDMPPGTGDVQLTLAQKVPVTGAVIVTTPQDIALLDARKGYRMFEKVGVPIFGVVENMSTHRCSQCGHEESIFGAGGAAKMVKDFGTELLGALPLDIRIRQQTDAGKPSMVADPEGDIANHYRAIARKVAIKIAQKTEDRTTRFPKIVIQKT